jgi:hypothetical protein
MDEMDSMDRMDGMDPKSSPKWIIRHVHQVHSVHMVHSSPACAPRTGGLAHFLRGKTCPLQIRTKHPKDILP